MSLRDLIWCLLGVVLVALSTCGLWDRAPSPQASIELRVGAWLGAFAVGAITAGWTLVIRFAYDMLVR